MIIIRAEKLRLFRHEPGDFTALLLRTKTAEKASYLFRRQLHLIDQLPAFEGKFDQNSEVYFQ